MSHRKMTEFVATKRTVSPIMQWFRNKLLRVNRAGYPDRDLVPGIRFPDTQVARDAHNDPNNLPSLPGGVHHKYSDNYYFTRDARREVVPPPAVYTDGKLMSVAGEEIQTSQVKKGPAENFGLADVPTPGFGFEWKRNKAEEEPHMQQTKEFAYLERYERYTAPPSQ